MTAVWSPGSVATSWLHLAFFFCQQWRRLEVSLMTQCWGWIGRWDWWGVRVMALAQASSFGWSWLYFAAAPRGMGLGNTAHLSTTRSSFQVLQNPEEFQYWFLWHVHICQWVSPKLTKEESGQGSGGGKDKQESQLNIPAKFCWSCVTGSVIQVPWYLLVGCKNTAV